jgi:hypothetical protein
VIGECEGIVLGITFSVKVSEKLSVGVKKFGRRVDFLVCPIGKGATKL